MSDVLFSVRNYVGLIHLNRPKALNALNHQMCLDIHAQLRVWRDDENVHAVIVTGEGEKAFCAGGDVVALYEAGKAFRAGDKTARGWQDFFRDEYQMNVAIAEFPKPYIAILDGITMGGGVGVSVHGDFRIATDRTMLAMPETGLGLFPDVGGGWFMPRLKGEYGMYLALSGDRVKAADCEALGITNGFVPSDRVGAFVDHLCGLDHVDHAAVKAAIKAFAADVGDARLTEHEAAINRCFGADRLDGVFKALQAEGGEWAEKTLAGLMKKSPSSMHVTFRQMRDGREMPDFRTNMVMEYRLACHSLQNDDFYEGVRAILIDKDMAPIWSPASFDGVGQALVDSYFTPFEGQDLVFEEGR